MVVVRHWSLPACLKTAELQSAGRGIPHEIVAGAVKRLLEACWPPVKLVEPAGYAPASAVCKTAVLLLNEGPWKMARRLRAARSGLGFGLPATQAGARREFEMVRSAGIAPASPDWHTGILLLNDGRMTARPVRAALWKIVERGRHGLPPARAPVCTKERTPLPRLSAPHPQDFSADVQVF